MFTFHRQSCRATLILAGCLTLVSFLGVSSSAVHLLDEKPARLSELIERIQLDTVRSGFTKTHCWVHPRTGVIPGAKPIVVMTMQELLLSGSDVFGPLHEMRTQDLGHK